MEPNTIIITISATEQGGTIIDTCVHEDVRVSDIHLAIETLTSNLQDALIQKCERDRLFTKADMKKYMQHWKASDLMAD